MPVNPKFIVNLKGKEFVMLGGLRELAEEKGIVDIRTEPVLELCVPSERFFVFCATGRFRDSEGSESQWVAYGDACPTNSQMKGAELRHAETRAVARMLRFATNVAMTAIEEMGPDSDSETPRRASPEPRTARSAPSPVHRATAPAEAAPTVLCSVDGCGVVLNPDELWASKKYWENLPPVCSTHGKERRRALSLLLEEAQATDG